MEQLKLFNWIALQITAIGTYDDTVSSGINIKHMLK